jgi:hypothetical protein
LYIVYLMYTLFKLLKIIRKSIQCQLIINNIRIIRIVDKIYVGTYLYFEDVGTVLEQLRTSE